jgi:ASCH domain
MGGGRMSTPMRALTLWQPWATLVATGHKRVENRRWRPTAGESAAWSGELAIHAGRSLDAVALAVLPALIRGLDLPTGAIVAVATVTGYHEPGPECGLWCDADARWHWEISEAVALDEPVPVRGQRGLWVPPIEVATMVRARAASSQRQAPEGRG